MLIFLLRAKRSQFDNKSQKCIFVGYSSSSKGYQLFNVDIKKLIVSRDVIFNEKASWDWNENKVQELPYAIFQQEEKIQREQHEEDVIPQSPTTLISNSNANPSQLPQVFFPFKHPRKWILESLIKLMFEPYHPVIKLKHKTATY